MSQADEHVRRYASEVVRVVIADAKVEYKARQKIKDQECLRAFAKRVVHNVLDLVRQKVQNEHQTECAKKSQQTEPEMPSFLDKEKIAPYKDFIKLSGLKTVDGSEIILIDTSILPRKKTFKRQPKGSPSAFNETMQSLCSYAEYFIDTKVKSGDYTILVHATNDTHTKTPALKWANHFYKILTSSYGGLKKCVISKPSLKLKAAVILKKSFMRSAMRNKLQLVDEVKKFCEGQGLPDSIISM